MSCGFPMMLPFVRTDSNSGVAISDSSQVRTESKIEISGSGQLRIEPQTLVQIRVKIRFWPFPNLKLIYCNLRRLRLVPPNFSPFFLLPPSLTFSVKELHFFRFFGQLYRLLLLTFIGRDTLPTLAAPETAVLTSMRKTSHFGHMLSVEQQSLS